MKCARGIRVATAVCAWLVTVGVSSAQDWTVPDVVGMSAGDARAALKVASPGARLAAVETLAGTYESREVSEQIPLGGTVLTPGEVIHVILKPISRAGDLKSTTSRTNEWFMVILLLNTVILIGFIAWQTKAIRDLRGQLTVRDAR